MLGELKGPWRSLGLPSPCNTHTEADAALQTGPQPTSCGWTDAAPELLQSVCLPIPYNGESVVRQRAPVGQHERRSVLHALKGEAVFDLIRYEYGVALLKLFQEGLSGRNRIQQERQKYEEHCLHLLANRAMSPFT